MTTPQLNYNPKLNYNPIVDRSGSQAIGSIGSILANLVSSMPAAFKQDKMASDEKAKKENMLKASATYSDVAGQMARFVGEDPSTIKGYDAPEFKSNPEKYHDYIGSLFQQYAQKYPDKIKEIQGLATSSNVSSPDQLAAMQAQSTQEQQRGAILGGYSAAQEAAANAGINAEAQAGAEQGQLADTMGQIQGRTPMGQAPAPIGDSMASGVPSIRDLNSQQTTQASSAVHDQMMAEKGWDKKKSELADQLQNRLITPDMFVTQSRKIDEMALQNQRDDKEQLVRTLERAVAAGRFIVDRNSNQDATNGWDPQHPENYLISNTKMPTTVNYTGTGRGAGAGAPGKPESERLFALYSQALARQNTAEYQNDRAAAAKYDAAIASSWANYIAALKKEGKPLPSSSSSTPVLKVVKNPKTEKFEFAQ